MMWPCQVNRRDACPPNSFSSIHLCHYSSSVSLDLKKEEGNIVGVESSELIITDNLAHPPPQVEPTFPWILHPQMRLNTKPWVGWVGCGQTLQV